MLNPPQHDDGKPAAPEIRVGPAGWSYKDWHGIVYPKPAPKGFKELDYLSSYFDTAEINSTFYRPANAFMGQAWARKVSHNPDFKFTAKLWQRFTHDRRAFTDEEVQAYTAGIDPLHESGRLGALLCQFPWSFKNDDGSRAWLATLFQAFGDYPLVVELRHSSWDVPATYKFLSQHRIGVAAIDQPVIGKSIAFKPIWAGNIGYVRMHGRNYKAWFAKKGDETVRKSPAARYDYHYSDKEIREIADRVREVSEGTEQTYVIQNNHPWGQAVANAFQLKAELGETLKEIPPTLIERYPELNRLLH